MNEADLRASLRVEKYLLTNVIYENRHIVIPRNDIGSFTDEYLDNIILKNIKSRGWNTQITNSSIIIIW